MKEEEETEKQKQVEGSELSLTHLRLQFQRLQGNYDQTTNWLSEIAGEVKSMTKDLKKVDSDAHKYLCSGFDKNRDAGQILHLIEKSIEVNSSERANNSNFVGRRGDGRVSCPKCSNLYFLNGELLKSIDNSNSAVDEY